MEHKWKFLSYRGTVYGIILLGASWLVLFLAVIYTTFTDLAILVLICVGIFLLVMTFLFFRQIVKPYHELEENIRLFLMGYTSRGLKENTVNFSPSSEQLFAMLIKLTESEQLLDSNKKQAQYLALQNQINPHFLYNVLENIRSEALFEGVENVAKMTEELSTFFRYTMSKVENLVTLKEELENIKIYFSIQKYRFDERLSLSVEYDDEDCLNYQIPKLTLQPIVENSIVHGLEQKIGEGRIRLIIRCTEKRLLIQISDNGVGMNPEVLEKLNKQLNEPVFEGLQLSSGKGGIAIVNVSNRIHLLFGEEYGMSVYSVPDMGTDTIISLPLLKR